MEQSARLRVAARPHPKRRAGGAYLAAQPASLSSQRIPRSYQTVRWRSYAANMGFLEFMLGKRLIDDEVDRFARNMETLADSDWAQKKRAKHSEKRLSKQWPELLVEARAVFEVPGGVWISGGEFTLLPSGDIGVPSIPSRPGLVRMEMVGPAAGECVALLSEHDSMAADESEWASDPEAGAHLLGGGQFVFHFLASATKDDGTPLDLASTANRQALVRLIEQRSEKSGHWILQTMDDRNSLILNPEAMQT